MSFSVFYAVRFSPAPELGEWLNVAVVGEGITERKAGVIVTESLDRIAAAFGPDAVERVRAIGKDLSELVSAMLVAHGRGEETQPIPTAMRDHALSMSFSEQVVVFEGTFEDALAGMAKKYLSRGTAGEAAPKEQATDIAKIAQSVQQKLTKFFPAAVVKTLEEGQRAIEGILNGPEGSTILVVGGKSLLGSALVPTLHESGKKVRLFDPAVGAACMDGADVVIFIPDGHASESVGLAQTAKARGVKRFLMAGGFQDQVLPGHDWEKDLHAVGDDRLAVTILRLGELYGHSQSGKWFGDITEIGSQSKTNSSVNAMTAAAMHGKVYATESGPRPYLHVQDAVTAILAILDAPIDLVEGQIYNVGSDRQIQTVSAVAALIKQQAPKAEFVIAKGESELPVESITFEQISRDLGFAPTQTLEEGIAQLIAAIKDGSVAKYLAARNSKLETPMGATPSTEPEILWDSLGCAPVDKETQPIDQKLRQH